MDTISNGKAASAKMLNRRVANTAHRVSQGLVAAGNAGAVSQGKTHSAAAAASNATAGCSIRPAHFFKMKRICRFLFRWLNRLNP
jgi:hypothetical protein